MVWNIYLKRFNYFIMSWKPNVLTNVPSLTYSVCLYHKRYKGIGIVILSAEWFKEIMADSIINCCTACINSFMLMLSVSNYRLWHPMVFNSNEIKHFIINVFILISSEKKNVLGQFRTKVFFLKNTFFK